MKKVLLFLLLGLFLISFASAAEWDNIGNYDPITREMTVTNALGLGSDIGKIRLNSNLHEKVAPTPYGKVAEFNLCAYQDYNDIIKNMNIYNKNFDNWMDHKENKDFDLLHIIGYEDEIIDDYDNVYIGEDSNGTASYSYEKVGEHTEPRPIYKKLTPSNLKKNECLDVEIWTEVKVGDYYEWIFEFYGVPVEEWASWTADLSVNLLSYYKLDETSGPVIDSQVNNNLTNNGATRGVTGIINNAFSFDGNDEATLGSRITTAVDDWTMQTWVNLSATGNQMFMFNGNDPAGYGVGVQAGTYQILYGGVAFHNSGVTATTGTWVHIIARRSSGALTLWVNGTSSGTLTTNAPPAPNDAFAVGSHNGGRYVTGLIDEAAFWDRALNDTEIGLLYNDGSALGLNSTDDSPPNIVLNSPSSGNFTSPQSITVNFTAWDDKNLTDVKLYVNDVLNQTNASGINNSNYLFDLYLLDGTYTIYGKATDNSSQSTNSSNITIIIDSTHPVVNITYPLPIEYNINVNELNYTVVEISQDSCWYSTDDGITNSTAVASGTNFTNVTSVEYSNTWTVYCNDTFGNVGSDNVTFTRDTVNVTLNSPANNSISLVSPTIFNATGNTTSGGYLANMSLWTNITGSWAVTQTNDNIYVEAIEYSNSTQVSYGANNNPTLVKTMTFDNPENVTLIRSQSWTVGDATGSTIRNLYYYNDSTEEWVNHTVTGTPTYYNSTNPSQDKFVEKIEIYLARGGTSGTIFENNTEVYTISPTTNSTETFSQAITGSTLWNVQVCDTNNICDFADDNYTVSPDISAPIINLTSPVGTSDYSYVGANETLNVTFTDTNLDSCWYNYNGTNITIEGCLTGVKNSTNFILEDKTNITVYANDTFGNMASNTTSWTYRILETNRSFANETNEGQNENFTINVESNVAISSASLVYNNETFTSSLNQISTNNYTIYNYFVIPSVDANTNVSFYWSILLSDGNMVNTSSSSILVNNISIDNCSAGIPSAIVIMEYDLFEEESQDVLNGTIEIDLDVLSSDGTTVISSFFRKYTNVSTAQVCINNLTNDTLDYKINSIASYTAPGFAEEFHYIQQGDLVPTTSPLNISLYDLSNNESTTFVMSYKGIDFLPLSGALFNIQRQYISEGIFKSVEIAQSDDEGFAKGHFDTEGVIYRITITKDGNIIDSFDNIKVLCDNAITEDCQINLNSFASGTDFATWNQFGGLTFEMDFDSDSRTNTVSFNTVDGTAQNITITGLSLDGSSTELCSSSLFSSAGVIQCIVPASFGNVTVVSTLSTNTINIISRTDTLSENPVDSFGVDAYVFAFILVISFPLMMISSPIAILFGLIFGVLASLMLIIADSSGLLGPTAAFTWLLVAGGILIYKMMRRDRL